MMNHSDEGSQGPDDRELFYAVRETGRCCRWHCLLLQILVVLDRKVGFASVTFRLWNVFRATAQTTHVVHDSMANTSKTPLCRLWSVLWISEKQTVGVLAPDPINRTVRAVRRGEAGRYLVPKEWKYIDFSRFCSQNTAFQTWIRPPNTPKSP